MRRTAEIPGYGVDVIQARVFALAGAGGRLKHSGDSVRWLGMNTSGLLTLDRDTFRAGDAATWTLTMPLPASSN